MKVTLLVLLFVYGPLEFSSEVNKERPSQRSQPSRATAATQDPWLAERKELIERLRQALDAAKKSSDPDLRKRANTLSGPVTSLIAEMRAANERRNFEDQVNALTEQLNPVPSVAPGKRSPDYSVQKSELTKRVDQALSTAEKAIASNERLDLKPRLRTLRDDSIRLKLAVAAITSSAEVDQVQYDLMEMEEESADVVKEATSWGITTSGVLGAVGIVLGLSSIVLLTITNVHFRNRLTELDARDHLYKQSVEQLTSKFAEVKQRFNSIEENNSRVQSDLSLQIASAQRSSEEAKRLAVSQDRLPAVTESVSEEVVSRGETCPTFPSLVSDYLNSVGDALKKAVENDFTTNTLVQTSAQAAPFMLIAEQGAADGVVLPKPRLQRGQDFSQFYKGYYACAEPSAGEVYIIRPARVERIGTRWRLQEMGKMEIH